MKQGKVRKHRRRRWLTGIITAVLGLGISYAGYGMLQRIDPDISIHRPTAGAWQIEHTLNFPITEPSSTMDVVVENRSIVSLESGSVNHHALEQLIQVLWNKHTRTNELHKTGLTGGGKSLLAVAPNGRDAVAVTSDTGAQVIDLDHHRTLAHIHIGPTPVGVTTTADGSYGAVLNAGNNTLTLLDLPDGGRVRRVKLDPFPRLLVPARYGDDLYVICSKGHGGVLDIISATSGMIVHRTILPTYPVAALPDTTGESLWLLDDSTHPTVYTLDPNTGVIRSSRPFPPSTQTVMAALSATGTIAIAYPHDPLLIANVVSGGTLARVSVPNVQNIRMMRFSPKGDSLWLSEVGGTASERGLYIVTWANGKALVRHVSLSDSQSAPMTEAIGFSPNGRLGVVVCEVLKDNRWSRQYTLLRERS